MSRPLSHSAYGRFVTCPKSYDLHYNKRLRPDAQPSHLIFGSAVDKGCNAILGETGSPLEACESELKRLVVEEVEFFKADYDGELIDPATKEVLRVKCSKIAGKDLDIDSTVAYMFAKPYSELSKKMRQVLALCCATSLKAKAALMLDAYRIKVMPYIKRVVSTQREVKWIDAHGNEFIGVLDAEVEMDGHGVLPADNKTASRPYDEDAVTKSTQLALYSRATKTTKAAFFVMEKTIRKNRIKLCSVCGHNGSGGRHKTCDANREGARCDGAWTETIQPEANIQIIVDDVPVHLQKLSVEAMSETAQIIKSNYFPRNLNACDNQYGRPCPYRNYCWKNDSTGLTVKAKDEK